MDKEKQQQIKYQLLLFKTRILRAAGAASVVFMRE